MLLAAESCACPLTNYGPVTISQSNTCNGQILFMMLLEGFLKGRCDIATPCVRNGYSKEVESEYDFIVVGGGSAGSIVAGRLSENEKFKVLLVEAGGEEPIVSKPPSFYRSYWFNEHIDWRYRTVPADYCLDQLGKGCEWPRGKVIGGSSVLNGMMYHRGHSADYDDWVKAGADGWSWKENKPYFDMTEGNKQIGSLVSGEYHSDTGPLPVQQFRYQPQAVHEILKAINESGFPVIDDMNDANTPHGFAIAQTFNENGQRVTTADAYLRPHSNRTNLYVKLNAQVTRLLINGSQVYGVEYLNEEGDKKTVRASKEVILSAGALNSPHILMLSGIGPKETLENNNIPVVADLPVGKNLRNHYGMTLYFKLTKEPNTDLLDWSVATEYLLKRDGPMSADGITQVTGLLYSSLADKSKKQPDLQFFFNGFYAECSRTGEVGEKAGDGGRNISINAAILLPRSTGYITINSSDPLQSPLFFPEYFTRSEDMIMIRDGAKALQKIFNSDTLQNKYGITLDSSYGDVCKNAGEEWSDAWVQCMARQYTDPQNHQGGTAAMGTVVDPHSLKVYNVTGVRVIDASVMPTQVTGNPQGAIMMVAERGAAFIKQEYQ